MKTAPAGGEFAGRRGVLHRGKRENTRARRKPFGRALAENQAIQWPLVELATQAEMLRLLIRKTAWEMDKLTQAQVEHRLSDKVSMCNFWANRLCCEAADRAMQCAWRHGFTRVTSRSNISTGIHRRYRITEGSEEIQKRKVAGFLFGYMGEGRSIERKTQLHHIHPNVR